MPSKKPFKKILIQFYDHLFKAFGPQHWWPAQTPFEVIVGAILTQNTNWGNVEKALHNLKISQCLSPRGLKDVPLSTLAKLIRPAGYFNVKARRLKNFITFFFQEYDGDISAMKHQSLKTLRQQLLHVNGIGPETADSILLYALDKPIFVVDAYTKRLLYRHDLIERDVDYHEVQQIFMNHLPSEVQLFNEYHALVVAVAKNYCRSKPRCEGCPLKDVHYNILKRCPICFKSSRSQCQNCQ